MSETCAFNSGQTNIMAVILRPAICCGVPPISHAFKETASATAEHDAAAVRA